MQLFPRCKKGNNNTDYVKEPSSLRGRSPIVIRREDISARFDSPLLEAARSYGLSVTAFKQTCRGLGIARWPYTRKEKVTTSSGCVHAAMDTGDSLLPNALVGPSVMIETEAQPQVLSFSCAAFVRGLPLSATTRVSLSATPRAKSKTRYMTLKTVVSTVVMTSDG